MPIAEIVFIGSVIVIMIYQLLFRLGFLRHRPVEVTDQVKGVSVIVAAHNEERNLKSLLPALLGQAHDNFEVIIADDRSNDASYEYLSGIDDPRLKVIRIDHLPPDINPKKNALDLAIGLAKNNTLLLTDADCVPLSDDWISWVAGGYTEPTEFVIGYSGYKTSKGFLNKYIRFETLMTAIQYLGLGMATGPYMGVGRNLSYRKEVYDSWGFEGILNITGGDDDLFVNKYASADNTRFVLRKDAQTISIPKESWKEYFAQKRRHLSVSRFYRFKDIAILGLFSFANLAFWVTFVYNSVAGAILLALLGYSIRLLTISLTFSTAASKLGEEYPKVFLPAMDIIYWIYNSFTALSSLAAKRIKWS